MKVKKANIELEPHLAARFPHAAVHRSNSDIPPHFRLGDSIARNRKRFGLTQGTLGAFLGVSAQAVSKWERQLACPDITLLPQISELFGISLDDLFSGTGDILPDVK